jgi:hypothetical protein
MNVIHWLIKNAEANEWQTRHAAENRYCPYCHNEDDAWTDQKEHHPGCEYIKMMELAKDKYHVG